MAHGAFDTVGAMRAGFPLVIKHLVAAGTGIPGWNQPMENMLGLILLSNGRLDGNSQNEKNEQGRNQALSLIENWPVRVNERNRDVTTAIYKSSTDKRSISKIKTELAGTGILKSSFAGMLWSRKPKWGLIRIRRFPPTRIPRTPFARPA